MGNVEASLEANKVPASGSLLQQVKSRNQGINAKQVERPRI